MSDREHSQIVPADAEAAKSEPAETVEAAGAPPAAGESRSGWTVGLVALAAVLLVAALVATATLWSPVLPWGPATDDETHRALAARVERLEAAPAQAAQQLQRQQQELRQQLQQAQQAAAEAKTALQGLVQRIEAVEARPGAPGGGDTAELRQHLAKLSQTVSDLGARVDRAEKGVREQVTRDAGDAALVMGLLQIRAAVQAGRPFAAEYEAFAALAQRHPEIVEAAAPLAEPAKTGVAGPAVLAKRLRELAGGIAGASAAAVPSDPEAAGWGEAALARLRGLVTIRRVDGARPDGPEAAVNAAELALAGGDLAAAVTALEKLSGAPAEAAAPWLRMARQRLTVDAALKRLEALVTARLGSPAAAPGSSG